MNALLMTCTVAGRPAALPAIAVESVIELGTITSVPGTPAHILGITALRSQSLTIIDCAYGLRSAPATIEVGHRAAVVKADGHLYAMLLDEANEVVEALSEPLAIPGGFGAGWARVARGLVETASGPLLLLDIEALVAGPKAPAD